MADTSGGDIKGDVAPDSYAGLVQHAEKVDAGTPLQAALDFMLRRGIDAVPVFGSDRFLGLCCQRQVSGLLGQQFGLALHGRKPVSGFLRPTCTVIREGVPSEEILGAVMERPPEVFNDSVVLFSEGDAYLGVIPVIALARMQSRILARRMSMLQSRGAELERLNGELMDAERRLREANRWMQAAHDSALENARAKSAFLASISHEFLTPMNGILGFVQLLEQSELTADQREYVQNAMASAERLLGCLKDLVTLTDAEAQRIVLVPGPCHLESLASDAVGRIRPAASARGIRVAMDAADVSGVSVLCDAPRLRQVLLHLLGNAVKFSGGGEILMRLRRVPAGGSAPDRIRFEVADQGSGIAPEDVRRLFRIFSPGDASLTRKQDGLGVGLAICQQLVGLMGGRIDVESEPGRGSRFWFEISLPPVPAAGLAPGLAA